MKEIKIGTRGSRLALIQTELVANRLSTGLSGESGLSFTPVIFRTRGDILHDVPLNQVGGKGVFSGEIEQALVAGTVELAVHSAKDLPAAIHPDTELLTVLPREDPADVLIMPRDRGYSIPGIIGTGSPRRKFLIRQLYPEAAFRLLRGNVPTRLEKLQKGEYEAIILAAAGIRRLKLDHDGRFDYVRLPPESFIPSGGQGIIALQIRKDHPLLSSVKRLVHYETQTALDAERLVLRELGAGCHEAAGVYAAFVSGVSDSAPQKAVFNIRYFLFRHGRLCRGCISGDAGRYRELAEKLLESCSSGRYEPFFSGGLL